MFQRLKKWVDDFYLTIRAGYYQPVDPARLQVTETEGDQDSETVLPRKTGILAGLGAVGIAGALVSDVLTTFLIAASAVAVTTFAGAAGAVGVAALGVAYFKCKKAGQEQIKDINAAGQFVSGTREDIYFLRRTQKKITGLFNTAAAPQMIDAEIRHIMKETQDIRARVHVDDPGQSPGHKKEYEFIRYKTDTVDAATTPLTEPVQAEVPKVLPKSLSRKERRQLREGGQKPQTPRVA